MPARAAVKCKLALFYLGLRDFCFGHFGYYSYRYQSADVGNNYLVSDLGEEDEYDDNKQVVEDANCSNDDVDDLD